MVEDASSYNLDRYRKDIRAAEVAVAALRPGIPPDQALTLLQLLDRIADATGRFEARGADLRVERTQIEMIHRTLRAKHQPVLKALRHLSTLPDLRAGHGVEDETRWWWYLDRHAAAEGARQFKQTLRLVGGVAALLGVLALVYILFLRPDEATRLRTGYTMDAEREIERGNYAHALALYRQALAIAPQDPEIHLMIGLMHEALEQPAPAAESYARAEALYETPAFFWAAKSQEYNTLGWYEQGLEAAQQAIDLDQQMAFAYCNRGGAYEGLGRILEAIAAFQQCADLARAQEQNELYVIAASRMATLMQMPLGPTPTGAAGPQGAQ